MSKLKKNIIYNIFGQVFTIILGFVSFKYIYSELGEDSLGIIYFCLMLSTLLSSALDMGLSKTTIREIASNYKDTNYVIKLTQTFSLFYWGAYVFVALIFVISLKWIMDSWINLTTIDSNLASRVLIIIGISSFLAIPKAFMTSICIGLQRMDVNNIIDVVVNILYQAGVIVLLINNKDLIVIAYWIAIINILRVLTYFVVISKLVKIEAMIPKFSLLVIKKIRHYTTKMAWVSILLVIHKQLDKVLISKLLPIGVLGIYSFTYNSIAKTTLITSAITNAVFPMFSELETQNNKNIMYQRYFSIQDFLIYATLPIFVLVIFVSKPVFTILLDETKSELLQLPVLFLCIAFYLNSTIRMVSTYVSAVGKPEYIVSVAKFLLFSSLPIAVILVVNLGLLGAALSLVFYNILGAFYMVPRVYKYELHKPISIWLKSVAIAIFSACIVYIPAWYLMKVFFEDKLLYLILTYFIATMLYGFIVVNFIGNDLREVILRYFPVIRTIIIQKSGI